MQEPQPQTFGEGLRAGARNGALWDSLAMALNSVARNPSPGIAGISAARMQNRREDAKTAASEAKAAQQQNKTVAWLRASGFGEWADAVESGALPAQQAVQFAMQKPERDKGVEIDGRLVNPYTGEVIADFNTGAEVDVKGESELRKEFQGLQGTKEFQKQATAYGRIRASAEDQSPAGDLALIFNYMKLLDPGSVVRESEFNTASQASAWLQRMGEDGYVVPRPIVNAIEMAKTGNRLQPHVVKDFLDRADRLYTDAQRQHEGSRGQYVSMAETYGYNVDRAVPDLGYVGRMAPQSSTRAPRRPDGLDTTPAPKRASRTYSAAEVAEVVRGLPEHAKDVLRSIPAPGQQLQYLIDQGYLQ